MGTKTVDMAKLKEVLDSECTVRVEGSPTGGYSAFTSHRGKDEEQADGCTPQEALSRLLDFVLTGQMDEMGG